ncbi:hypothetical protein Pmani_013968 [Petrolisthes manimaculis]|uniref:Uncharacterized protein n=1 Tax=Petrolisthes manimaculis TaxID=1843537 RepID=A0AAE1PXD1_9EUCA|nr:hypothetical protein Pmani_013968 [Petrolisthes manimaculis]
MDKDKRKSILKGDDNEEKVNKRLSFAVDMAESDSISSTSDSTATPVVGTRRSYTDIIPTNMQTIIQNLDVTPTKQRMKSKPGSDQTANPTSEMSWEGDSVFFSKSLICSSVKRTPFGTCYVPDEPSSRPSINRGNFIPVEKSQRNDVLAVLSSYASLKPTANVLIIGEEGMGEKIKSYLQKLHSLQIISPHAAQNITLNIICNEVPDHKQILEGHFFLITVKIENLGCMAKLRNVVSKLQGAGVINQRIEVIPVIPAEGLYMAAVDMDEFDSYIYQEGLTNYAWKEQGRPGMNEGRRLLERIYGSVGYCNGTSLALDHAVLSLKKEGDQTEEY